MDAVRIAACPDAAGMGVLTVLNNEIHSARDVTKSNTFRVETFRPNELGFLGYADADGEVVFYRAPTRKHTTATPFDVAGMNSLPRVDIVYAMVAPMACWWTPCGKTAPTAWCWWDSAPAPCRQQCERPAPRRSRTAYE